MRTRAATLLILAFCLAGLRLSGEPSEEGRLMRFPDVYKDKVVFSHGGDLWLVAGDGGVARRITTNPGLELFPKFSPDGKWIAFTGQYDGNFNVYVIPSDGGQPKQLTFLPDIGSVPERMGPNNEVISWYPDSKRILFLSRRNTFNSWFGRLFSVSVEGGLPEQLPLDKGGLTSFNADGTKIAYNRIFRNFRTWKRYKGGMAQDIWIYDFKANTTDRVTDYVGTDSFPMWRGDSIYFTSDRGPDHRMNLYRHDLTGNSDHQLTHFTDYDVNWPSQGPDAIVFENGGYLYLFDPGTGQSKKLTVYLPGDNSTTRKSWKDVATLVTSADLAPDGKRAVLTARGDVFSVPAEHGSIEDLTESSGSREKFATWSPDGKWIAYVSDRTGEEELYIRAPRAGGAEEQITHGGTSFLLAPEWSPDSQKLLYADSSVRLFYVDIKSRQPVKIDTGEYDDLTDYSWSPDSQWVAYAKAAANENSAIYLYSLANSRATSVTDRFTNSWRPVFDPGGKYLWFLSNRDYNEVTGAYDIGFADPKATRVFLATLQSDVPSPVAPRDDETGAEPAKKTDPPSDEQKEFHIDVDGIADRVVALPIQPGNLDDLAAGKDLVFYTVKPVDGLSGPLAGAGPAIHCFDLKQRKDAVAVEGATAFALSFDRTKLLYEAPEKPEAPEYPGPSKNAYGIVDATFPKTPHKVGEGALDLTAMQAEVDPRAEWSQIFSEVWRQERDFFFEKAMNGVDWKAERERYAPLLSHVADRYDLTYILGEMIGELSNSHTYVGGGDSPDLKPVNVGLLGVDFEEDAAHGLYRFKKIYKGENWDTSLRSPLTEPGVNVKEGDYLLAVNGHPLRVPQNPYEIFTNTAGKTVTLSISSGPSDENARDIQVQTIASELSLRELDWINTNRHKVDQMSEGKIGYVYIPDMEGHGLNEFVKQYFPQIDKEGLIIDVRYNGGGFVDPMIFERLRRVLAAMQAARHWKSATVPEKAFHGYLSCVTNHYAASDGDIFTYLFKQYKLGPVIGERTWGGVRGIRGFMPLVDGGYITRPEFSLYGTDSKWVIENHGVEPDVEVDNSPDLVRDGRDPQLEKAVDMMLQRIQAQPRELPPTPPALPAYPGQ